MSFSETELSAAYEEGRWCGLCIYGVVMDPPCCTQLAPDTASVLAEVLEERARQDAKWGQQDHADGTHPAYRSEARQAQAECDTRFRTGLGSWADILREEFFEVMAETNTAALRTELVQVAAVAAAWVEAIDRRTATTTVTVVPDIVDEVAK